MTTSYLLRNTGFDQMEGLHCPRTDIAHGPMAHKSVPNQVVVSKSTSCYDLESGYMIREDESFNTFQVRCFEQPISVIIHHDKLVVQGGGCCPDRSLNIQFQRTLRVPDDDKEYNLSRRARPFSNFQFSPVPELSSLHHAR